MFLSINKYNKSLFNVYTDFSIFKQVEAGFRDKLAIWLENFMKHLRVDEGYAQQVEQVLTLVATIIIAIIIYLLLKYILGALIKKSLKKLLITYKLENLVNKLLNRLTIVVVSIIFISFLPAVFLKNIEFLRFLIKIGIVIIIIFFISAISIIAKIIYIVISNKSKFKQKPLKGFFQILQIILYFLGAIVIASIIINKSPAGLLAGLGAFAAILSFIFKDTILGFISGIQLSANDMVRPGDWIVVPNSLANGVVIDITLITVKVQNFDNTIVTVPAYSLVTSPFQNWRGMEQSGGRRITLAFNIDMLSVKFLTPDELIKYSAYIEIPPIFKQNKITNLALYRFYLNTYLHKNPNVSDKMLTMVRYLDPSTQGVPMQLYCFSNNISWVIYEGIKSEIIEHTIAMAKIFELTIYQLLSQPPEN